MAMWSFMAASNSLLMCQPPEKLHPVAIRLGNLAANGLQTPNGFDGSVISLA